MAEKYITRPITVPTIVEAVSARARRTGMSEREVAASFGEEVYREWERESKARKPLAVAR